MSRAGGASWSSTSGHRACARPSCDPTPPSSTSTACPCCPIHRPRAWWSSTPRAWPTPSSSVARTALGDGGPVAGVGIANQRASTIVWERATGRPVAPGIGWQDLRTVGTCLVLQAEGIRLAPERVGDQGDGDSRRGRSGAGRAERGELCFGTVDSWVAWTLSGGAAAGSDALHVTDATNAAVTALVDATIGWDESLLRSCVSPCRCCRDRRLLRGGRARRRTPGAPPICGIAGDQQASLVGQGCTLPGPGQGHLRDRGHARPVHRARDRARPMARGDAGTFPIVAFRVGGTATWGTEAVMLSAGTGIEWLRDDLGIIATAKESGKVAAQCASSGDVWFVPALLGSARRSGTSAHVGRSSGSPVARAGPRSSAPSSRAWRTGVPTWSRRASADSGFPIWRCASTAAWRTTTCSSRPWPTPSVAPSRSRPCSRRPRWARGSWLDWPSAPTPRPPSSPTPSRPAERSSPRATRPIASRSVTAGWPPAQGRRHHSGALGISF